MGRLWQATRRWLGGAARLPNFLVVGFPKSGTTSLHYYLRQHPEVFLPARKELHFLNVVGVSQETLATELFPFEEEFRRLLTRDLGSYSSHFRGSARFALVGEVTPSYAVTFERTVWNIYKYLESGRDTKILMVLRNPMTASYSHYNMQRRRGIEFVSFEDSLALSELRRRYNHYRRDHVRTFRYAPSIRHFQDNFSHVMVLLSEDLHHDPHATMSAVCDFLGIDPRHPFVLDARLNVGEYAEPLGAEARARVYALFRDDIARTESLIGRDLSSWREGVEDTQGQVGA